MTTWKSVFLSSTTKTINISSFTFSNMNKACTLKKNKELVWKAIEIYSINLARGFFGALLWYQFCRPGERGVTGTKKKLDPSITIKTEKVAIFGSYNTCPCTLKRFSIYTGSIMYFLCSIVNAISASFIFRALSQVIQFLVDFNLLIIL